MGGGGGGRDLGDTQGITFEGENPCGRATCLPTRLVLQYRLVVPLGPHGL